MGNSSIFVFQIRRIGDFFQSVPLLNSLYTDISAGLASQNNDTHKAEKKEELKGKKEKEEKEERNKTKNRTKIDILVDINILDIKDFLNNALELITFEDLFSTSYKNHKCRNDLDSLASLNNIKSRISQFLSEYQLAINLNFDINSGLLLNFFDNAVKRGFIYINKSAKTSEAILRRGAANYFYNSVKNRKLNKLNIIDIFSLIGYAKPAELKINYDILKLKLNTGSKNKNRSKYIKTLNLNLKVPCIKTTDARERAGIKLSDTGMLESAAQNKFRICISTGASSEKRLWGTKNYSKLAELLLKNLNCEITFVGTKEDVDDVAEIKNLLFSSLSDPNDIDNFKQKLVDITGKTSLSELIYIIKDFNLIISTDTGTLHIAQILQVPAVSIFIGNANFYETGPHLNKSYAICSKAACYPCLENELCKYNFSCKNDIKPEDVFLLAAMTFKKSSAVKKELISNIKKGNSDVFFCDNSCSIHYYPIVKKNIGKNELASEILKYCWIYILSGCSVKPDVDNILKNCKKYYKISTALPKELLSEITFIMTVFENAKHSFVSQSAKENGNFSGSLCNTENNSDALYFYRFKKAVKEIGRNYEYLKLVSDYFIDEIDFSIGKAFDDIILLLSAAINILKKI
jgi:ADP-heptose:LPS heptosyltransferase